MKKENSIDDNKNSKKISKNNKIISSILAVVMCCQSFVGVVTSDSQLVDSKETNSKETVEIMEGKDKDGVEISEDEDDVKKNDEDEDEGEGENEDESKKNDAVDKSKWLLDLAKTIVGVCVSGVGALVIYKVIKVIYNAIKSNVVGIKEVELDAKSPEDKLLKDESEDEPEVTEPETDLKKVQIGNESYLTHSIGKKNEDDIGFENLIVIMGNCGGIPEFVNEILRDFSDALSQVKVKSNYENKIDKLSSYSKFIVAIIKGEDCFLDYLKINDVKPTTESVVKHACELLENQKNPEFRLVNAYVEVKIGGDTIYFLISQELAPYLEKKPPVQPL
ncbi:MAG: hypothetical protein CfP315_0897 [Candidatus Improbicoccus pseudotrichonymphae]|uniref:Uncharacterized protein n=1 Tax=Candidatus Improbicoccus pseudotrichonymphae TaxID=3033792 RepID=A0AA48HVS5_9FIRM|nr:MAG: hypothetical protein CfP315_0897 [Candidatus Improbicoccus pseudotrichonymphae]